MFTIDDVIYAYPLEQAIADEVLVPIFSNDWYWLTGGKPVVATKAIVADIPNDDLKLLWDKFAKERNESTETHNYHFFSGSHKSERVWIIEDEIAVTFMYPHEY